MKVKKDKKQEKRSSDDQQLAQTGNLNKIKTHAKESDLGDGQDIPQPTPAVNKPLKKVDIHVFKYFNELTCDEEKSRIEAASKLLHEIGRNKEPEKRQKEFHYTITRLIRGCGASTNISRAGFFTGLVGFLKFFDSKEITLDKVFETLNKELNVGSTISNKEDADAVVGKILVCGALLHSGRLTEANSEHIEQITNILLKSSHHRTYHASLGLSFLCEIVESISENQFETCVWPLLQKDIIKPWSKQTMQTVHCLISVQKKFPQIVNKKFLKTNFGGKELLNPESFQHLHKIFWSQSNTDILTHPAFECFGSYIATGKYLCQFWSEVVENGLENPTKLVEVVTLKILTDILDNLNVEQTNVHELLTDNFMRMFIEGLKTLKQKKDETLKAFYADFLESLVKCCGKLSMDAGKVAVIKRLILPPGIFSIEKFTGHRIVHQLINTLGEDGVKDIFELYKSIFLGTLVKNPENASETWLNFERLNAGYMLQHLLQHKSVQASYKWREEQLKFLLTCGIFHVTDSAEICKKEDVGTFSTDFAEQCKNMFYTCLQSKLSEIQQEQQLLFNLAAYCQERLLQKNAAKYFRVQKFDESLEKLWNNMFESVSQSKKDKKKKKVSEATNKIDNKLQTVFNILLLNMGLQLFCEAEMAGPAINDLLKCLEKSRQQNTMKKNSNKTNDTATQQEQEPEWIEVVVDLFLHLLSQNNSALRNIVNALFPHLCDNLTLSSVHEILSMLDMKDGNNPLSTKNEDDEEEEEEEENEEEGNKETENLINGINEESDDESDEDDESEDEDDDEEQDDDDGVTASDKLRNAISQALLDNGFDTHVNDDMGSVDLNEMTEEEGRKLDEALSNAFKALKNSSSGKAESKKSKSYRIKTTSVTHFRIRVLDLIEIYLQQKPSLFLAIEIMLALYNMLEYCVGDELRPLQIKVEKILTKLTSHKNYTNEDDIKDDNIVDFIRLIAEKKTPAVVYEIVNKMRNKCICFLISNAHKINADQNSEKVLKLCQEYTNEFIKSRNPIVNITLLSDIFKLRWIKLWNIAEDLAQQGLVPQTRAFRRIQICEILTILYKNNELQKYDEQSAKKHLKKIGKSVSNYIKVLSENDSVQHSAKEFQTLLELILTADRVQQRLQMQNILTSENTLNSLQNLRKYIRLESAQVYQRFCNKFNLQLIRNDVNKSKTEHNDSECENDNKCTKPSEKTTKTDSITQKRKLSEKDLRKNKKLKKQKRLEAASKGLNGGIGFTQRNGSNTNIDHDDNDNEED